MEYNERFYRNYYQSTSALRFTLIEDESDIDIILELPSTSPFTREQVTSQLLDHLKFLRQQLKEHMHISPDFLTALVPVPPVYPCPLWIESMYHGTQAAEVGPMASVAGAIAQALGHYILATYGDVEFFIENGGDIYLHTKRERLIQVFAGTSPLSNKICFKIYPDQSPIGICTSAGTVGPSLSFGKADAVVVIAKDTALADAFATRLGNEVQDQDTIPLALEIGKKNASLQGILIIIGEHLGAWGRIELV